MPYTLWLLLLLLYRKHIYNWTVADIIFIKSDSTEEQKIVVSSEMQQQWENITCNNILQYT